MAIGSDSQASSGAYVWIPEGTGNVLDNPLLAVGSVAYTFSVPVAGNYVVWGRLIDNLGNSFFVSMDSGSYALWDTVGGSTWGWDRVNNRGVADPVVYSLGVGQHTLVIKHREDGAKLDRILVTNDMAYVPQGQGEVSAVPSISVSPASLSASAAQGGNASSQSFQVRNSGGGTLSYTISDSATWLSTTPTSGTSTGGQDTITVNYATSGLSAGTYSATITVTASGATNSPQTIPVSLTISAVPSISVSPASLSASAAQGSNAPSQSFQVGNFGGGTLSYTISDSATWLSTTPTSGTSTGEQDTITVNYATSGLSAGTYSATITVTASGATNSPQTIPVSLTISAVPSISVSPASLSASAAQGS